MNDLERLRRQNDRRSLVTLGRLSHHPRIYDSEVRADAGAWDIARLAVEPTAVVSLQDAAGSSGIVAGISEWEGPLPL
jgi:hypothetical protein